MISSSAMNAMSGLQMSSNGWRPIASAPKDGTDVILYFPELPMAVVIDRFYSRETFNYGKSEGKSEYWGSGVFGRGRPVPTHWMPIPEAPR